MKKVAVAFLFPSLFVVPIFLNLRAGEKAGQFWDGEEHRYVVRGEPEYAVAVFNRKLLLVTFPLLVFGACLKSLRQP